MSPYNVVDQCSCNSMFEASDGIAKGIGYGDPKNPKDPEVTAFCNSGSNVHCNWGQRDHPGCQNFSG